MFDRCKTRSTFRRACLSDWRNRPLKRKTKIIDFNVWILKTWVKLLFTATHSFMSSPSGNMTAKRKLPLPNVIMSCLPNSKLASLVPSVLRGLNVLFDLFPLFNLKKIIFIFISLIFVKTLLCQSYNKKLIAEDFLFYWFAFVSSFPSNLLEQFYDLVSFISYLNAQNIYRF